MKIAIVFSGFLGNLRRSFASVKKNVIPSTSDVDVYIVTPRLNENLVKVVNTGNSSNVKHMRHKGYTMSEITNCIPYNIAKVIEWKKNKELQKEHDLEVSNYISRSSGYDSKAKIVGWYDKDKKRILNSTIPGVIDQFWGISLAIKEILSSGIKYDYIIKFRDKYIIKDKIPENIFSFNGLAVIGEKLSFTYMQESFVIGEYNIFIKSFKDFSKNIGKYRPMIVEDLPIGTVDPTFFPEVQFACHVSNILSVSEIFTMGLTVNLKNAKSSEEFGKSLYSGIFNDYEWVVEKNKEMEFPRIVNQILYCKDIKNWKCNADMLELTVDSKDIVDSYDKKLKLDISTSEQGSVTVKTIASIKSFNVNGEHNLCSVEIPKGNIEKIEVISTVDFNINSSSLKIIHTESPKVKIEDWRYPRIPKILFTYWYGNMSYLNYLTLKSFRYHNPDWRIIVYIPKYPSSLDPTWKTGENESPYTGKDYYSQISEFNVEIVPVDFSAIGFSNDHNEVIKSDYLRLFMLSKHGGFWSDMDIYYIRGMKSFDLSGFMKSGDFTSLNTVLSFNEDNVFSIGFMASSPGNPFFDYLSKTAVSNYNKSDYQCIGSTLFRKCFKNIDIVVSKFPLLSIANISSDFVYPYKWFETRELFIENRTPDFYSERMMYHERKRENIRNSNVNGMGQETTRFIGLHWFAGHPNAKEFVNNADYDKKVTINNIIKKYPCSDAIIVAFIQMFNESSSGNLVRCLENCKEWANYIFIYDDCSTDDSVEIASKYTKYIIRGKKNEWEKETFHKQELLEYCIREVNPDWILWIDCDETLDKNATNGGIREFCNNHVCEKETAYVFKQINLWRGIKKYRIDSYFYREKFPVNVGCPSGWFVRLWRITPNTKFETKEGKDNLMYPANYTYFSPLNFKVIHYGFSDYQKLLKKKGLTTDEVQKMIENGVGKDLWIFDERKCECRDVPLEWIP